MGSYTRTSHPSLKRMREISYESSLEYELNHQYANNSERLSYRLRKLPYKTSTRSLSPVLWKSSSAIFVIVASSKRLIQSVDWTSLSKRNGLYRCRISGSSAFSEIARVRYAYSGSRIGFSVARIADTLLRSPVELVCIAKIVPFSRCGAMVVIEGSDLKMFCPQ